MGNKGTVRISVSHVEYVDQTCLSCEDEEGPMPLGMCQLCPCPITVRHGYRDHLGMSVLLNLRLL